MSESMTPAWALTLIEALTSVTDAVSHRKRLKSTRYFVWQEDGANDLAGDGGHAEGAVTGTLDLYIIVIAVLQNCGIAGLARCIKDPGADSVAGVDRTGGVSIGAILII